MTEHPLAFLDELESRRSHPAGKSTPMDTATLFHDEVDAQTGRLLPRTINPGYAVTACRIGFEPTTRATRIVGCILGAVAVVMVAAALVFGGAA